MSRFSLKTHMTYVWTFLKLNLNPLAILLSINITNRISGWYDKQHFLENIFGRGAIVSTSQMHDMCSRLFANRIDSADTSDGFNIDK